MLTPLMSQGAVSSTVYILVLSVLIPCIFGGNNQHADFSHARLAEYLAALLSVGLAAFMGKLASICYNSPTMTLKKPIAPPFSAHINAHMTIAHTTPSSSTAVRCALKLFQRHAFTQHSTILP